MRRTSCLGLVAVTLIANQARASAIDVRTITTAVAGETEPALVATARVAVTDLRVTLVRTGCGPETKLALQAGDLLAGAQRSFALPQPLGRCSYTGKLLARVGGTPAEQPLAFDTELAGPPLVRVLARSLEPSTHTVRVTFNRTADHGEVASIASDGTFVGKVSDQPLGEAPPGESLSLSYSPDAGEPLKLLITVFDPAGLSGSAVLQSPP